MRGRFTRARRAILLAAAVASGLASLAGGLALGGSAAPARPAGAAEPIGLVVKPGQASPCGRTCVSLVTPALGQETAMSVVLPAQVPAAGRVGRKINMLDKGFSKPSGQFTLTMIARVRQFCGSDRHDFFPPGSFLCRRESSFRMFEVAWSPHGNQTDLCAGVALAGRDGQNVTLRTCGRDARTFWIADWAHGAGRPCPVPGDSCPWISAADSNFRRPFVLTLDARTYAPADQLRLARLATVHGRAVDGQLFSFVGQPGR